MVLKDGGMMSCSGLAGHRVLRGRAAENVGRHCCRFGLKEACVTFGLTQPGSRCVQWLATLQTLSHVAPTQLQAQYKVLRHKGKELRGS